MELNTPLACLAVAIGTAGGAFLLSSIKKRKEVKKEESVEHVDNEYISYGLIVLQF